VIAHNATSPRAGPGARGAGGGLLAVTRRHDLWLAAALLLLLGALAIAAIITFEWNRVLAYTDSASHLVIPRRIIDNRDIGLTQLGVHWGPLFHLLQVPLVAVDPLFRSGASATIVSAGSALLTGLFLYRLALLVGATRAAAFTAVAILVAAPSFLYVSVIPMHYTLTMATTTGSIYLLTRWAITGAGASLVGAGLMLSLATLTHFDTWMLWPMELLAVGLIGWRRHYDRRRTEATALLWGVAGTYGIVVFLLMNITIFGDPFEFLKSFQKAAAPIEASIGAGLHLNFSGAIAGVFFRRDPEVILRSLGDLPEAAALVAGLPLAIAGTVGAVLYVLRWRRDVRYLVPLLLFYPFAFYGAWAIFRSTLIAGEGLPEGWNNLRYANIVFPAFAFFLAVGIRWWPARLVAVFSIAVFALASISTNNVAAWREAFAGHKEKRDIREAAEWLGNRAEPGDTIAFPFHHYHVDRFELESGLPLETFVDKNDTAAYRTIRQALVAKPFYHYHGRRLEFHSARRESFVGKKEKAKYQRIDESVVTKAKSGRYSRPGAIYPRWIVVLGLGHKEEVKRLRQRAGSIGLCYSAGIQRVQIFAVASPPGAREPRKVPDEDVCRSFGVGERLYGTRAANQRGA
jgi:hypothetical protein